MYINTFSSHLISPFERALIGMSERAAKRVTTVGEFKGVHIVIDHFKDAQDVILQKRYVLWDNSTQLVWYKNKNAEGKFDLLI